MSLGHGVGAQRPRFAALSRARSSEQEASDNNALLGIMASPRSVQVGPSECLFHVPVLQRLRRSVQAYVNGHDAN
jgi:hypothetical protein